MNWAEPAYAWLLLLGVPAALLLRRARLRSREDMRRIAGSGFDQPSLWSSRRLVAVLALLLAIAALCRPQWGEVAVRQESSGLDILIALDVSRSMLADDLAPSRLAAAKKMLADLLPQLRGDRIGLIAFSGSAFLVCPLTRDHDTFASVLGEASQATIPVGGTSLTEALSEARRAFEAATGQAKLLLVISDGEDHGGDHGGNLRASAEALRDAGITTHVIAAGTPSGALLPLGEGKFVKDRQGAPVRSRLRSEPLRQLANITGGRYFDLVADTKALTDLRALEPAERTTREIAGSRRQLDERFQWPLALALLLLLLEPFIVRRDAS